MERQVYLERFSSETEVQEYQEEMERSLYRHPDKFTLYTKYTSLKPFKSQPGNLLKANPEIFQKPTEKLASVDGFVSEKWLQQEQND